MGDENKASLRLHPWALLLSTAELNLLWSDLGFPNAQQLKMQTETLSAKPLVRGRNGLGKILSDSELAKDLSLTFV